MQKKGPLRIAVFCEAIGDFTIATDLLVRVLAEEGPPWVQEYLESLPFHNLVEWVQAGNQIFFDIHKIRDEARVRRVLLPHNRFDGKKGSPGALLALTASLVARNEATHSSPIDIVLLVWDMDNQPEERKEGLRQGRGASTLPMILGCPDMEREAWVLAGFEPATSAEQANLEDQREALGFDPRTSAERLRDNNNAGTRSPKRVLRILVQGDSVREARCWREPSLHLLTERGEKNGLRAYLTELRDQLMPLFR